MQISIIIIAIACSTFAFRQQTIGIRGQLFCGDKPLPDARVKVWNKNKIGTDDQLIDVTTNATGHFEAVGGVGAYFSVDPHLKIYHSCDHNISLFGLKAKKPCKRKVDLGIPSSFVSRSGHVEEYFEVGRMNMQLIFPDEETKCLA